MWGGTSDYKLNQIQVVMNQALRSILHVKFHANYTPSVPTNCMYKIKRCPEVFYSEVHAS